MFLSFVFAALIVITSMMYQYLVNSFSLVKFMKIFNYTCFIKQ